MKRFRLILQTALLSAGLFYCNSLPVFAITEADVEAQVNAVGRDAVTGNLFVWFICAVAFLKVSQKIDSFISSLGIHVGNTGSSMLSEAMIAARGIGMMTSFGGFRNSKSGGTGSSHAKSGGFSGGLIGIAGRKITNSATKAVTEPVPGSMSPAPRSINTPGSHSTAGSTAQTGANSTVKNTTAVHGGTNISHGGIHKSSDTTGGKLPGLGGRIYSASVSHGGAFANNIISSIATGNSRELGTITGDKASEALMSYLGYNALEEGAKDVPSFSHVEIGGGMITGTESSGAHPDGIDFGMYHTGQYTPPKGAYETVYTTDGNAWYKQYAADSVEKSPYSAPDGTVAYHESIVKRLPSPPVRKDRI